MSRQKFSNWLKNSHPALKAAFKETWTICGIRLPPVKDTDFLMLRIGRSAARILPDSKVEITEFLRVSPDVEDYEQASKEAAWTSTGGGIFTDSQPSGIPCGLDNRGMQAARADWYDFIETFRMRLEALEAKHGKSCFMKYENTVSAGFGFKAPVRSGLQVEIITELRGLLTDAFAGAAEEATLKWREQLPAEILNLMQSVRWNSCAEWNWLCAIEAPHRKQGIKAFPWAATVMRADMNVLKALENRLPLIPAISESMLLPEVIVRRLNGMPAPETGFSILANAAADLNAPPRTEHGWHCWQAAVRVFRNRCRMPKCSSYDNLPDDFPELMKSVPDMWLDLHHTISGPFELQDEDENLFFTTLEDCALRVQRWEADNGAANTILREAFPIAKYSGDGWEALHEIFEAGYGLKAVPLCSSEELLEEGKCMQHCVSGYAPACRVSGCHIISFRNAWGESVATAEISQRVLFPFLSSISEAPAASRLLPQGYVQFKGKRNASPPDSAWLALHAHAGALMTGRLKCDKNKLEAALNARKSAAGNLGAIRNMNAGYNVDAHGALRAVLRLYTPFISGKMTKTLGKFIRHHDLP